MSKYNANTKVTFSVSTGYVGCRKTETFTLGEIGYEVDKSLLVPLPYSNRWVTPNLK